jgi:TetR/AcrR family transcriptional repressor of nem operon
MARPRGFDEAGALDAATECFRRRGYAAASVRDLTQSMGIGATSLYNSFGDKRALFVKALERYVERSVRARIKRLECSLPPKRAIRTLIEEVIRTLIEEVIERSVTDRSRGGCLLINSALEVAPHDPDLAKAIAASLGEIEAFFRRSVVAAQAEGTIPRSRKPRDLSRMLLGIVLAIRVLTRSKPERSLLEGMVRPALAALD